MLFIESDIQQAITINQLTKKPVFCVANGVMYASQNITPQIKFQYEELSNETSNY